MDNSYDLLIQSAAYLLRANGREAEDAMTNYSTPFFRLPEVLQITGMSKTFIYDRINDGTFPKQIKLGSRMVLWN